MPRVILIVLGILLAAVPRAASSDCTLEGATVLARYQLDEDNGVVAHDEVGGHDGALVNGPMWDPDGGLLCGGGALTLDGDNDYVDLPGGAWDDFAPDQSLCVSCCFRPAAVQPGTPHIVARYHPSYDDGICLGYGIEFEGGPSYPGHVWFSLRTDYGGAALYVVSTEPYAPDIWHSACGVRDRVNDELRLYVDGELAAPPVPDTFPEDQGLTQTHFVIGRCGDADHSYFAGQVDRVEICVGEDLCPALPRSWGVIKSLYQ